jgi:SAM-dependent methyltransferase
VAFHAAGKVALDHIYTRPDPRGYFGTLRELEYGIPGLAAPTFARLIAELRATVTRPTGPGPAVTVVDLGCSYGINSALLRCDLTMADLYERYCAADPDASPEELAAADRALVARRGRTDVRFIGLDISADALAYARAAGFVDEAVRADLEHDDPTSEQRAVLGPADLVLSTGCIGYIGEQTLGRLAQAGDRPPWMAHTVLRMYRFEPMAQRLTELGYQTRAVGELLRQRRFASAEEQSNVLDTLAGLGVDPTGRESDGWLYARMYVSRPVTA